MGVRIVEEMLRRYKEQKGDIIFEYYVISNKFIVKNKLRKTKIFIPIDGCMYMTYKELICLLEANDV